MGPKQGAPVDGACRARDRQDGQSATCPIRKSSEPRLGQIGQTVYQKQSDIDIQRLVRQESKNRCPSDQGRWSYRIRTCYGARGSRETFVE